MVKADQSAPSLSGVPSATTTYPTAAVAVASGGGGQGSIEWSNGYSQGVPGSRTTQARWSGNGNYNASPWSSSITLTMNKADQAAPTAYGASVSVGNTATATVDGGGGIGSLEWSNGYTLSSCGSKTTKARWSGNSNYNPSPWSNEVTLSVSDSGSCRLSYSGIANDMSSGGLIVYGSTYSASFVLGGPNANNGTWSGCSLNTSDARSAMTFSGQFDGGSDVGGNIFNANDGI